MTNTASRTHHVTPQQRGILHISAGSADWNPTSEDLAALLSLFQTAQLDPNGAIVVTRHDVRAEYIGGPDGMVLATYPGVSPGEILRHDFMEPYGLSVEDLAARTFVAKDVMAKIVEGEYTLSATVATCLSRLFGTTPRFWLNLEADYRLAQTQLENGHHFDQIVRVGQEPV